MTTRPPAHRSAIGLFGSVYELFGIVLMRFRPLQRTWGTWLIVVNAASLLFIRHVEAQVALGAVGVAALAQSLIYQRKGFIRLLGVTHVLWIPMLVWMALRLDAVPRDEVAFHGWLVALIVTNAFSLVIDAWDATRFVRGERRPHYVWR